MIPPDQSLKDKNIMKFVMKDAKQSSSFLTEAFDDSYRPSISIYNNN
jgi:hypothetical protein